MNTASIVVGNHAFLFPEGQPFTSPEAGTCGRLAKPDAADTGWEDPGIVESLKVQKSADKREIFAPTPGQKRLYDIIEVNRDLKFTISLSQASPLMFEHLFGTLPLNSKSAQYNPLEGATKKGWLKVQQYDHTDSLVNTVDVFCHMEIDGEVDFSDETVSYDLTCRVLHSAYNTGTLIASD